MIHATHRALRAMFVTAALALPSAVVPGCADPAPSFAWQSVLTDLPGAMLSVWGSSSRDIYVVGAQGQDGSGPYALHFNGSAWTRLNTTLRTGDLWWVHGAATDAVYMVGSGGTVLQFNPTTRAMTRMPTPSTAPTLFGVWGLTRDDVWAVGGDTRNNTGVLWHYDGRAWQNVALPNNLGATAILYKVWGRARDDVWAVGANGTTVHYDGRAWTQVQIPASARGPLFTVHGAGAARYAVGGNASGILLEADGAGWKQAELFDAPRLAGVFAPASGAPLAVGNEGSVYLRRNGSWRLASRPPQTDLDFHATWIEPDTGAVWAVGGQVQSTPLVAGLVMRFSTGAALPTAVTTPPELTACPNERGTLCTWAGNGVQGFNGDGRTPRETAMYWPLDMEFAPDGTPYFIDWNNHMIRRLNAAGRVETVVGTDLPGDGPPDGMGDLTEPGAMGTTVSLNHPTDLLFGNDGRLLFVAWHNHKIRRFDPQTGRVFVTIGRGPGLMDGVQAATSLLKQPSKAVFDRAGNFYILDQGNGRIRRVGTDGMITTIAGNGMRGYAGDGGPAAMAVFNWQGGENPEPEGGLAMGPDGNLYVADTGNHRIRRIDLSNMTIDTVVGDGMFRFAGDDGPARMASLYAPQDIEFGPDGQLYIADSQNHRIRTVNLQTGVITTIAGTGTHGYSGDRGPAREAQLWRPWGLAFDRDGNLFISDTLNNRIRRLQLR